MGNTAARQRRSRGRDLEAGVPGGAVRPDASVATTGRPTSGRIEPTARVTVRAPKVTPTATIRSLLNLKKHMLKLVPDETRTGTYRLSFSIDTAKACR
ncbi:hypothetical protein CBR_g8892 [Chara braunii]|uniref:Uncharacterized protein n=1 Tax=Chara braunii TaxID=69332 RepID=A0A388KN69_CHABU|nr:hypothetical protein CBR_g8892 [Chara braunii]|eukprot:GBG71475.1 hypothetical protein CBR_g8892 [Chara braunii]